MYKICTSHQESQGHKDTRKDIIGDKPEEEYGDNVNNKVKKWLKHKEVRRHAKRLKNLKNNLHTLYMTVPVWGQYSSGLQEVIKGNQKYDENTSKFHMI